MFSEKENSYFFFECYTATYLQNVGKKEEVLVIKLQFVVVSVLFQPQLRKVTQRFFSQKITRVKKCNTFHSLCNYFESRGGYRKVPKY